MGTNTLFMAACLIAGLNHPTRALQDSPVEIPKKELPKAAICAVCEANGEGHKEEKPAAGLRFKGRSYYFCSAKEVAEFKKDPDAFLPPILPRPAPALELATLDGLKASLADYKGKVVLVDW